MKSLVISSGSIKDYSFLKTQVESCDYIICADGGLDHLIKINENPDLVVGDLDSISDRGIDYIKENKILIEEFPEMKNETDTELAIYHAIEEGFNEIILVGALGGNRVDHSLANIFLLKDLNDKNVKGKIIDETNIIQYETEYMKVDKKTDYKVSLIPMSDDGIVVSLKGFLYPLDKYHIKKGKTIGISNEIIKDYGEIIIHKGETLVIESKD